MQRKEFYFAFVDLKKKKHLKEVTRWALKKTGVEMQSCMRVMNAVMYEGGECSEGAQTVVRAA